MPQQTQYAYDTFISYSHVDRAWVWGELLPRLEAAGLKVSIDDRDFEIGVPSLINMERAVDTSRHTLVVLTPAWIASEWTEFESLLVGATDPAGRQGRVLPILLKPCALPRRLAVLTHADFTKPSERAREMDKLVRTISDRSSQTTPPTPEHTVPLLTTDRTVTVAQPEGWTASDSVALAELLRRSGRAGYAARQALCIDIGIAPDDLDFLTSIAPRDFALRLVDHLYQTGDFAAMLRLCDTMTTVLRGPHATTLETLRAKLI